MEKKEISRSLLGKPSQQTVERVQDRPSLAGASFANTDSDARVQGVLVRSVERGSPAYQVGLRAGDIIVSVNRDDISNVDEFTRGYGRQQTGRFVYKSQRRGISWLSLGKLNAPLKSGAAQICVAP